VKAATADLHNQHRGPPERSTNDQTRKQCGEHPSDDRSGHKARGTLQLKPARKGGGDLRSRKARKHGQRLCRAAAAISTHPRCASQRGRDPHSRLQTMPKMILNWSYLRALTCAANMVSARVSACCIAQKGRSGLMQQGRKPSGGQGLPDHAAEEQATWPRRARGGERGLERPSNRG
jgi:hypothetical protein